MRKAGFFVALSIALAGQSHAYDAVLKALKGEVMVRSAKSDVFKPAKRNHKLMSNDQVRTGTDSIVHLSFVSGSTVLVKERARFVVKVDRVGEFISFSRGEFLIGLRRKVKPGHKFYVRTPAAAAAVRGTVFWGLSDDDKSTTFACLTGSIDVSTQKQTVGLAPGQKVLVPHGGAIGAQVPSGIPDDFIDSFAILGSVNGVDEILRKGAQ